MITYKDQLHEVEAKDLNGFFVGWPKPPSPKKHYELLEGSQYKWLAIDEKNGKVVGFITAISDGVLSAYIPLLEVLPAYQKQGIGGNLVKMMASTLSEYYMIDLLCDEAMQAFYERFNMVKVKGMCLRNYKKQSGR